jgi:Nickel responsive protein SCO4226-like
MELVLVERRFDSPIRYEDIVDLEIAGASCHQIRSVRFRKSFFSRDRRRMLCLFEAPDAESVRDAESQARVPFNRAWTCINLQGSSYTKVRSVSNALRQSGWCLDLHNAEYVESFLGNDGRRMVCLFLAPDAEAVRRANQQGGVPYTEIWTASVHFSGETGSGPISYAP